MWSKAWCAKRGGINRLAGEGGLGKIIICRDDATRRFATRNLASSRTSLCTLCARLREISAGRGATTGGRRFLDALDPLVDNFEKLLEETLETFARSLHRMQILMAIHEK